MPEKYEGPTVLAEGREGWSQRLRTALDEGHIWPAFQPITDIRTGLVAGFEVLARWSDPHDGEIGPALFIPHLEEHGLIGILFDALIDKACREAANWSGNFWLAFNASPAQLACADFPQRFVALVGKTGFPLNRVELEITEGLLFTDGNQADVILQQVSDLGIRIGIDDFGTGYSSLARLAVFPFHKLKMDASFVRGLDTDPGKRRIVAAVVGLGQSLGLTVVAEGVETAAEETVLFNLGCDLGQGWHYGKGEPAELAQLRAAKGERPLHVTPLDNSPFQQFSQLATLYDQAPVGMCFLDMSFRHVRANDRFAKIHSRTKADLEGRTVYELMEGQQLQWVIDDLAKAAASEEPVIREQVFHGRDVRVINTRVLDPGGEIIGISLISIDVTEENQLEQALREERDYANAVVNSLPGIFYHYDADMRLLRWNERSVQITGYSAEELVSTDPWEHFPPEKRDEIKAVIRQIIETGYGEMEADYIFKDGSRHPHLLTGVRFDYKGRPGLIGTGTDLSEHRKVEEVLRQRTTILETLIHHAPDGLLVMDSEGKRIIQNNRMNEIWNVPEDIANDPDCWALLNYAASQTKDPAGFLARVNLQPQNPQGKYYESVELSDDTVVQLHTAPLIDENGKYNGHVWACLNRAVRL